MKNKLIYSIAFKTAGGGYNTTTKTFTEEEFESYYDSITESGGKVIGFTTDKVKSIKA